MCLIKKQIINIRLIYGIFWHGGCYITSIQRGKGSVVGANLKVLVILGIREDAL